MSFYKMTKKKNQRDQSRYHGGCVRKSERRFPSMRSPGKSRILYFGFFEFYQISDDISFNLPSQRFTSVFAGASAETTAYGSLVCQRYQTLKKIGKNAGHCCNRRFLIKSDCRCVLDQAANHYLMGMNDPTAVRRQIPGFAPAEQTKGPETFS